MPRQRYDNLGSVGLNTDLQPSALPPAAWTVLDNVACENGVLRSVYGEAKSWDLPCRPLFHTTFRKLTGEWYAVVSNGKRIYMVDLADGTSTDITPNELHNILDVWDLSPGWEVVSTGVFKHTKGTTPLRQDIKCKIGETYTVSWTVKKRTAGDFFVELGGVVTTAQTVTGTLTVVATAKTGLVITPADTFAGELSLISVIVKAEKVVSSKWDMPGGWVEDPDGTFTHTNGTDPLTHSVSLLVGGVYSISWTVTDRTTGSFTIEMGGVTTTARTATGSVNLTAVNSNPLEITPTDDFNGALSNIVVTAQINLVATNNWVITTSVIAENPPQYWVEIEDEVFKHYPWAGTDYLTQNLPLVIGTTYTITWTMTGRTYGFVSLVIGGVIRGEVTSSGSMTFTAVASEWPLHLEFTASMGFDGTLSGIRVFYPETVLDLNSWDGLGSGWTEDVDNEFTHGSGTEPLSQNIVCVIGESYEVSWVVTGRTVGSFDMRLGGATTKTQTESKTVTVKATSTGGLYFTPTTDFNGTLSEISVKDPTELIANDKWVIDLGWEQIALGELEHTKWTNPLIQDVSGVVGSVYNVAWKVRDRKSGSFTFAFAGAYTPPQTASGSVVMTAVDTTGLTITPTEDFKGTIYDITIKRQLVELTADYVSLTNLNSVLVANSDTNGPFYLGETRLLPLPGWDPDWQCREMVAYRYYLVALNMTEEGKEYPHKLRWSGSAEEGAVPAVWVPTIANDAGDDLLGETLGHIVGGRVVRDQLSIIKEDAAYSLSYVGGQFVMRSDRLHGSVGSALQKGYADMGGGLATASARDLVVFDGNTAASIAVGAVREALEALALDANWNKVVVFAHKASNTLWVAGSTEPANPPVGEYTLTFSITVEGTPRTGEYESVPWVAVHYASVTKRVYWDGSGWTDEFPAVYHQLPAGTYTFTRTVPADDALAGIEAMMGLCNTGCTYNERPWNLLITAGGYNTWAAQSYPGYTARELVEQPDGSWRYSGENSGCDDCGVKLNATLVEPVPGGRLTSALVFDWAARTWWAKQLSNGYGFDALRHTDQGGPLTEIVLYESNDTDSQWWLANLAVQDASSDNTPKTCQVERVGLPVEGADGLVMVREAWLDLDGTANLAVAFGGQVTPDGPVTWAAPQTWTPGISHNLTPRITGRFLAVSIQSASSGWWKLGAITVDWTRAGER